MAKAWIVREHLPDGSVSDNGYYDYDELMDDIENEWSKGTCPFEVIECTPEDVRYGLITDDMVDRDIALACRRAEELDMFFALRKAGSDMEYYHNSVVKSRQNYENAVRTEANDFTVMCAEYELNEHEKMYSDAKKHANEVEEAAIAKGMTRNDCCLVIQVGQEMAD